LEKRGQILVKQLKNRYKDVFTNRKFLVGISRAKMKLSNLDEQVAQDGLIGVGFEDEISNDKPKMFVKGKATKEKVSSWQIE
jgi:glycerol-3-phosphate responsive antiterminator